MTPDDAGSGDPESNARSDPSTDIEGETGGAECPYCESTDTYREHPKGPGLCRSMHFCRGCEEPFERFG